MTGGQQEVANNDRDTDHEKDHEVAEDHLAKERRPVEREKGADAAKGKRRHLTDGKDKAKRNDSKAIVDGLHRMTVEVSADPPRRPSKQPLNAETQGYKNGKQRQSLEPPVFAKVSRHKTVRSLNLVGQIGECGAERHDVLADRSYARVEVVGDRTRLRV
jgi:hypothetical protein